MAPVVTDHPGPDPVPLASLIPLRHHLPHSFAVLRRAQFTHFAQGTTPHAHFLFASDPSGPFRDGAGDDDDPAQGPKHFAAAYLDLSRHPETEMYLYSTLQDVPDPGAALPAAEVAHALSLVAALFGRVRHVAAQQQQHPHPRAGRAGVGVMVGNLHEATYRLLLDAGRCGLRSSYWNPHDVWLFRVGDLPGGGGGGEVAEALPADDGLRWSVIRREDVPLIASRTKIPKEADTLMSEPSVAVRDARGGLVAWGFMGVAGTLSTLHVEEPYRGKGIAKAIATKVMREHSFGDDGWGSADVHVDNVQSQGLCKSLGATKGMRTCWAVINFDSMPSPHLGDTAKPSS